MAGLQRSSVSFRRQGSSGLIWEDRLLSGDLNQMKKRQEEAEGGVEYRELRTSQSVGSIGLTGRSRSGGGRAWGAAKVSPAIEPPSPKVSGCGFCGMLGRSASTKQPKSRKH
ncbi:MAPK kinase substrate protein At1g80180-like [Magnolia sinica]|uniref:MAPK kinase substrate protein At1g80180-like n=1 Tax=Magnolia sinica TaxID=86752 RepID=UPI00265903A9|nr:MAPK kinase substrate protein At1g80180-like [Magnolia sinica]